jgi:hypothetical protein
MKVSIETISPETAKLWLELNFKNRNADDQWVITLARVMLDGLWKPNGDSIKFDLNGHLIDGQHRLMAVVKSGVTIQSAVARNVECNPDDRKVRTLADAFQFEVEDHARVFARAISKVWQIKQFISAKSKGNKLTNIEALAFFKENEGKLRAALEIVGYTEKLLLSRDLMVGWTFLFCASDQDKGRTFIELFKTGENIGRSHPVYLLRKALMEDLLASRKMKWQSKNAIIIKAWNAFKAGAQVKLLKFNPQQEKFPAID